MIAVKYSKINYIRDNPDIWQWIVDNQNINGFIGDMYDRVVRNRGINDKQIQGIKNSMKYVEKKNIADQLREDNKDIEPSGSYVGTIKKRYDMTLKYRGGFVTQRGFTVHNFINKEGQYLICFSDESQIRIDHDFTKGPDHNLHILGEGDCFTCRATINRHSVQDFDPMNKYKQTVLNRIKYTKYIGNKKHLE